MRTHTRRFVVFLSVLFLSCLAANTAGAQTGTTSGTITGIVTDPTGAVLPGATVTIQNPVSQYQRSAKTDNAGHFQFANVPFNSYHLTVAMTGFGTYVSDVGVKATTPINLPVTMVLGAAATTVQVNAEDLVSNTPTMDTEIDRKAFAEIPLESASSGLSSLVTLSSPGVAADSNGLFHGLGDHASNSFSVDGQPITDQQSKVFSNQLPSNCGPVHRGHRRRAPGRVRRQNQPRHPGHHPLRPGRHQTHRPDQRLLRLLRLRHRRLRSRLRRQEVGQLHRRRRPQHRPLPRLRRSSPSSTTKGNEQNVFDRVDYQFTAADSVHLNLNYTRSWFQTPNTYDNLNVQKSSAAAPAPIPSSPTWATPTSAPRSHLQHRAQLTPASSTTTPSSISAPTSASDNYHYYPSSNPLADLGPVQQQSHRPGSHVSPMPASHSDLSYVKGPNNIKVGAVYEQTFSARDDRASCNPPRSALRRPTAIRCRIPTAQCVRDRQRQLPTTLARALRLHPRRQPTTTSSATPT